MYATGQGAPSDPIEAHKWFILAAEHGDIAAKKNSVHSAELMAPPQVTEAKHRAQEWKKARAERPIN